MRNRVRGDALPPTGTDDVELVRRVAEGHEGALTELHDRYAPMLISLALRILGDREGAEEVFQETFLQVWRQARRYDAERSTVSTWLVMMIRSRALDLYRCRRVRERTAKTVRQQEGRRPPVRAVGHENVLTEQRRKRVRDELERIPLSQRQVIELAYFEGLSQREIAERLAAPLGTVKTRTFLALKKLRHGLGDELTDLI